MAQGSRRFPGQVKGSAFIFETWVPKMSRRALTPGEPLRKEGNSIPCTPLFLSELQCAIAWSDLSEVLQKRTTQKVFIFSLFTGKFSIK